MAQSRFTQMLEEQKRRQNQQGTMGGASFRGAETIQDIAGMQGVGLGGTLDAEMGSRQFRAGRQWNSGGGVRINDMKYLDRQEGPAPTIQAPQMTQEDAARRARERGGIEPVPGFFGQLGQGLMETGRSIIQSPTQLGANIGGFLGTQKYGTGLSAEGDATGRPIAPNTLPGQSLTLGATGLEFMGNVAQGAKTTAGIAGQGAEYLTGANIVEGGPVNPSPPVQIAQPDQATQQTQPAVPSVQAPTYNPNVQFGMQGGYTNPLAAGIEMAGGDRSIASGLQTMTNPTVQPSINAPMGQDATRAALQARFGAPTIREIEAGQTGGIQATDPQGRLRTFESPEARQAAFDQNQASFDAQSLSRQQGIGGTGSFAGDSAAREQRIADRPDFGAAVSDRERRGTGEMSMAEATRMAGGDRKKARQMIEMQRQQGSGQAAMTPQEQANLERTQTQTETERLRQAQLMQDIQSVARDASEEERQEIEKLSAGALELDDSLAKLTETADEIGILQTAPATGGWTGWTLSKLPFDTPIRQIERLSAEFEGSAFIRGIIDAKARGATFGSLTEREGDRIIGAFGKLTDASQSDSDRIRHINTMLETVQTARNRAYEKLNKATGRGRPSSGASEGQQQTQEPQQFQDIKVRRVS